MYIAFLTVSPLDKGPSLSRYVKKALDVIQESGISYQLTPMGTVLESDKLDEIFDVSGKAAEAIRDEGADRVSLSLKVDMRYDKEITMKSKIDSVS